MAKEKIQCEVNGQQVTLEVEPDELLIDVLRDHFGVKRDQGGMPSWGVWCLLRHPERRVVTSCLLPVMKADGGKITTVEGA